MNKEDTIARFINLKIGHYECPDCWYSCPKSPEGCCDDSKENDKCYCGADEHNKQIDNLITLIRDLI